MSLVLVRVDDRLVHGQVVVGWRDYLNATQVLVASDRLAGNAMASSLLRLSVPADLTLVIERVEPLARRIASGEFNSERAILLFESLEDILRAVDQGMRFDHLNLGGLRHQESCCLAFSPSVSLTQHDVDVMRRIMKRGIPVDVQMVPREKPIHVDLSHLERRKGR